MESTVETGDLSKLSFRLHFEGGDLGALNLFSTKADAFNDKSERVGLLPPVPSRRRLVHVESEPYLFSFKGLAHGGCSGESPG